MSFFVKGVNYERENELGDFCSEDLKFFANTSASAVKNKAYSFPFGQVGPFKFKGRTNSDPGHIPIEWRVNRSFPGQISEFTEDQVCNRDAILSLTP